MWLLKSLVESIVFLPVTVNDVIVLCANVVRTIGALFKYLQITYLANQWGFLMSIRCTIMYCSFVKEITQYRYWLKIFEYFLTRVSFTENIYRRINNSGPIVVVEANWTKTAFLRYNSSHYYLREGAFNCRAHSTTPPPPPKSFSPRSLYKHWSSHSTSSPTRPAIAHHLRPSLALHLVV